MTRKAAPTPPSAVADPQQILDEIHDLQRELAARRATSRSPSGSVVRAYQVLLERQFERLDELDEGVERSINAP
jgi:hypothetical protein